ncbi:MAG: hypothetical protein ACM3ZV_08880 [Bacillota bacterium]
MSEQQDKQQRAEIEQVNEELTRALRLCHSVVEDYRSKLAANLTQSPANDDQDELG